jgi:hypothetical protein
MTDAWHIRLAAPDEVEAIIELSDEASTWLVDHGLSGHWGPGPPSSDPSFVARIPSWIRDGEASVAVSEDGEVLGYSVVGRPCAAALRSSGRASFGRRRHLRVYTG